jgi:hypothetical protein
MNTRPLNLALMATDDDDDISDWASDKTPIFGSENGAATSMAHSNGSPPRFSSMIRNINLIRSPPDKASN